MLVGGKLCCISFMKRIDSDRAEQIHSHVCLKYRGKFYDSECLNGVYDLEDLPYVVREVKRWDYLDSNRKSWYIFSHEYDNGNQGAQMFQWDWQYTNKAYDSDNRILFSLSNRLHKRWLIEK